MVWCKMVGQEGVKVRREGAAGGVSWDEESQAG